MKLLNFLGGVGLLLYGMQLLSEALCHLAGVRPGTSGQGSDRLRRAGPVSCAAWGAAITAVAESSGAVTLFAMSAADAGLLTVRQAVAVCWGANLGTTATGQILSLGGSGALNSALLSPLACFGGAALVLFARGKAKTAGQALLGFGLTFTGLSGVQTALLPLLQDGRAARLLARLEQPGVAFLAGILLAAGLQSSSAAVALAQAAAGSGLLNWGTVVPLVMGTDIGTCSTALLASLGFGKEKPAARRVAAGHLLFNLAACAGGWLGLWLLRDASFWRLPAGFSGVSNFQTAFNGVTLLALLPLLTTTRGTGARCFFAKKQQKTF